MVHLAVEVPDVDAVMLAHRDDLRVVLRVEENVVDLIGVSDEALEEVRVRLLSFVVPDFDHVVLTARQEVA